MQYTQWSGAPHEVRLSATISANRCEIEIPWRPQPLWTYRSTCKPSPSSWNSMSILKHLKSFKKKPSNIHILETCVYITHTHISLNSKSSYAVSTHLKNSRQIGKIAKMNKTLEPPPSIKRIISPKKSSPIYTLHVNHHKTKVFRPDSKVKSWHPGGNQLELVLDIPTFSEGGGKLLLFFGDKKVFMIVASKFSEESFVVDDYELIQKYVFFNIIVVVHTDF